ncbi:putative transcription factor gsfR1 [Talaromyces pinophilus]|nr:putative transcription factor gsfR1 [Talaromyces pinophilus]
MDTTHHRDPISTGYEYPVKQRKVRKGTRSCWECKRRKVRCSFSAVNDNSTVCVACRRRRTPCVSQEFLEDYAPPSSSEGVPDHDTTDSVHKIPKSTIPESTALLTPESSRSSTYDDYQVLSGVHKLAELSKTLHAALPTQADIDLICKTTSGCFLVILQLHTRPREELDHDEDKLKREVADTPPANTHPIILARHLLLLANLLQDMHADKRNIRMSEPPQTIMDRLLDTVSTLVMTRESLAATIDGLQCVLLEGCFHANGGNLRSAWLAFRRALSLGQLLGLDRPQIPSLPIIDSKRKVDLHQLWFRILYFDTFYSMMLGLPQSNIATPTALCNSFANNKSIDQLERLQVQVASQIIERDTRHAFAEEYETTREIDRQLLQVARDMPNRFWLPSPPSASSSEKEVIMAGFRDTAILMDILIYYNLLNQLHLPYLLWSDFGDTNYEYSKIACIQASREVLTRFIILLNSNNLSFFCQRIDYFVLMASMTLLLVYLGNHRSPQDPTKTSSAIPHLLTPHQRLSDRATMKQVLRLIERASAKGFEESQRKGINLLRCLLSIEADAASGQNYIITTGPSHYQQESEYFDTHSSDTEDSVCINIPYLGMIKITRQIPSVPEMMNPLQPNAVHGESLYHSSTTNHVPEQFPYNSMALQDLGDDLAAASDDFPLSFQDIDLDFFDSLVRGRDFEFGLEGFDGVV